MIDKVKHMLMPLVRRIRGCTNRWPISRLERCNMDLYEQKQGYRFDIRKPQTFTEKIQWYKLYYDNGSRVNIVDKALFKDYVRERLGDGYTIRMFNVYSDLESIERDWDNLPEEFVLKSTVQSDGKFIKVIRKQSALRFEDIKDELKEIASRLSEGFPFVRVDFFDTDEKLLVAEMTLYPGGGMVPYHPESFNRELGERFILPQ